MITYWWVGDGNKYTQCSNYAEADGDTYNCLVAEKSQGGSVSKLASSVQVSSDLKKLNEAEDGERSHAEISKAARALENLDET